MIELCKRSHFIDVPQANLLAWHGSQANPLAWYRETKPNTTKAHIHQSKQIYYNAKELKPGLVASYNIRPGNGEGLFWFWRFIDLSLIYLLT